MITRKALLGALALAASVAGLAPARADYPDRQIKIVLALPPGGSADTIGRMFADHIKAKWGQTVIVESRSGADGLIGPTYVAKSKPDGYTLFFTTPSLASARALFKNPPLDPEKDLVAIGQVVESPFVVAINTKHQAKTLKEFVDAAKAAKGAMNIGYFAAGNRLTVESFLRAVDVKATQVPYKGEAAMMAALSTGEVDVGVATAVIVKGMAEQGKVRPLAVTGETRSFTLPDVPTAKEAGAEAFQPSAVWFGLLGPAGLPQDIVAKLSKEVFAFAQQPDLAKRLEPFGFAPKPTTPEAFAALIRHEAQRSVEIARAAGIEQQ
ncbi:MAG TPA: tripartite tricarboxylate transporter substrate binding protein [Beijerinckiaceae bacterium]